MKSARHRLAASLTALIIVLGAGQAHAEVLNYTVLRDGKPIGAHAVAIDQSGFETHVKIETDITVKVLFINAYTFKHTSQEQWVDGRLMSITSTTQDDGIDKKLNVRTEDGRFTVDSTVKGQERRQHADAATLPASLWNPATVKQNALLNTLDGEVMDVVIDDLGAETVEVGGASLSARHYAINGELTRELWFDDAGRLVRMRFPDKTNTEIVYALN